MVRNSACRPFAMRPRSGRAVRMSSRRCLPDLRGYRLTAEGSDARCRVQSGPATQRTKRK